MNEINKIKIKYKNSKQRIGDLKRLTSLDWRVIKNSWLLFQRIHVAVINCQDSGPL